jgi:serine/threonine-protein kinase
MPPFDEALWRKLSPLLDRALELEPEERQALIGSLRAATPEVADALERLLGGQPSLSAAGFLETPPGAEAVPSLAGQNLGPYTLVDLLGSGGMGTVWRARRSDGRFEGDVALKLLNLAVFDRAGEERFRREGTLLSRLAHPNIARLFDAGVSASGQPFLVLELVDGSRLDEHASSSRLDVRARLELFTQVADAVAHAHSNLVVHRDLKPSNILVDREGRVKLLDFGIALLLDEAAGESSTRTMTSGRALTLAYAAPEQVQGQPVTTTTDVYALGVLLYELLCGSHPTSRVEATPAATILALVEREAALPSDVVAALPADATETVRLLEERGTTRERLQRALRGDLDTILAKALKKLPAERYATAAAFADDVRRHLFDQPVRARPDAAWYRARKFAARHRLEVGAAAAIALALVVGITLALAQARIAARQRNFALRQLARAEAINDLNFFLLSDAAPGGKPFTVGDLLHRAERIVHRQRDEPAEDRAEMLVAVGRQYQSHDEIAQARALLTEAYELGRASPEPSTRARVACALASTLSQAGEFQPAERLIAEGLRQLSDEPAYRLHRVFCLLRGSEVARDADDSDRALERVLAAQHLLDESGQGSKLLALRVAMDVAESYRTAGREREANAAFARAAVRLDALGLGDSETAGTLLNNWALVLRSLGRPLEAERLFRRAIETGSAGEAEESVSPMLLNNFARTLDDLGRFDEARAYAERAFALAKRADDEIVVTYSLFARAQIETHLGLVERAADTISELEVRLRATYPPGHLQFAVLESQKGLLAQARGDFDGAIAALDRAIALAERSPQGAAFLPRALLRRAEIELLAGRPQRARADAERALELERSTSDPGAAASWLGLAHLALARAHLAEGDRDAARSALATALEQLVPTLGEGHIETLRAHRLAEEIRLAEEVSSRPTAAPRERARPTP